ncbi:DHHW family protein [Cohnella thermotolerans]|uniref:DHHW family protein n=1 Tax=Cohnella thermotolerans TaxID=329858 RepID=UPI00041A27FB|nr:DHHW family protein [Cohnella thermotolerans]
MLYRIRIFVVILVVLLLFGAGTVHMARSQEEAGAAPGNGESTVVNVNGVNYLVMEDRAASLFTYSASAAEQYAAALNRFAKSVDSKVNVYSLLVPTAAEFIDNAKAQAASASQKAAFDRINGLLDSRLVRVDAYSALEAHKSEYVYFRTDHHWTALGAYYAYGKLMESMGEQPAALSEYKNGTIKGFLGSEYKATKSAELAKRPDTLVYYTPSRKYTFTAHTSSGKSSSRKVVDPRYAKQGNGYYAVFLGGDFPWGEIATGSKNGKKLAVVKDSFANALIPFLLPHFETIDVIDPRYFKDNLLDFVKERQITDVLFLNNSTVARTTGIATLLNEVMDAAD